VKLLLIHNSYRIFGGEDSNIIDEYNGLKTNFNVNYLEFSNKDNLNIFDFIFFILGYSYKGNKSIKNKIKEFNPDLIYVHNLWFRGGLGLFKIAKQKNIPVYVKFHNFRHECSNFFLKKSHFNGNKVCPKCGNDYQKGLINKYYDESLIKSIFLSVYSKRFIKKLKKYEVNIFALNSFHKKNLRNIFTNNKISIVFNPITKTPKENNIYNSRSEYIIFAGRLVDSKGIVELISSWEKAKIDNLDLYILGEGPLKKYVEKKSKELDNLIYLGFKQVPETIEYIKNSRAVVTATKSYEGQPRFLTEASVNSVPSIFPEYGGMSEYFPENYPLKFKQYDYEDLISKLYYLENHEFLNEQSNMIDDYFKKNLDRFNILNSIKKIISH